MIGLRPILELGPGLRPIETLGYSSVGLLYSAGMD